MKLTAFDAVFLLPVLALLAQTCHAQSAAKPALRDPTQPPTAYAIATGERSAPRAMLKPQQIVTIGGTRYLVWNSRRYAVGESIEGARIERISESEVWLKGADGVRKLSLFTGIDKRPPNSGAPNNTSTRSSLDGKKGPQK
jgi:hypothetical protein